jgi:Delta-aminolevulinic acid dehydratase
VYTDVALDPYNSDGHDGIVRDDGVIMNDETVEYLCRQVTMLAQILYLPAIAWKTGWMTSNECIYKPHGNGRQDCALPAVVCCDDTASVSMFLPKPRWSPWKGFPDKPWCCAVGNACNPITFVCGAGASLGPSSLVLLTALVGDQQGGSEAWPTAGGCSHVEAGT